MEKFDFDVYDGVKERKLNINEKIRIAVELVKTMKGMRSAEVNHRDVKPQNLLVKKNENGMTIKLSDFGIGRGRYQIEGTPGFSPVDLSGQWGCDWYSVAVTVAFLVFEKRSFWQAMFQPLLTKEERRKMEKSENQFEREALEVIDTLMEMGYADEIEVTLKYLLLKYNSVNQ